MRIQENEMIELFRRGIDKYAPLTIKNLELGVVLKERYRADALIEFCILGGSCFKALAEFKSVATPKTISETTQQLTNVINKMNDKNISPVLIVPYMRMEQIKMLQRENISWIDLSGNMIIRAQNGIYIERTGRKNLFPDTSPIKKIFEGTSSLVSRALILKKEPFRSLYEVMDFINQRGGKITLSTVSKVLNSLEEELLITKKTSYITAIDREKLLEKLSQGYRRWNIYKTYRFAVEDINDLFTKFYESKIDYAACGFYAAKIKGLATTDRISVFIKSLNEAEKAFELNLSNIKYDSEFGQLDLIETKNICVWFNVQGKPFNNIVDDIELYLEMKNDTPRGPKIAETLKKRILGDEING